MNVSSIQSSENSRVNMFIKYSNSFMSMQNSNEQSVEKAVKIKSAADKAHEKMGIETLTIFPKEIVDGKMIITA